MIINIEGDFKNNKIMPGSRYYKHQRLMREFNDFTMRMKIHFFMDNEELKKNHLKPTIEELDDISNKIYNVLRDNSSESGIKQ